MTATITITIPAGNAGDLSRIFELEREGVLPREALTYCPDPPRYVIDLEGDQVAYLIEQLSLTVDMAAGRSLVEWRAMNANQMQLPIEPVPGSWSVKF